MQLFVPTCLHSDFLTSKPQNPIIWTMEMDENSLSCMSSWRFGLTSATGKRLIMFHDWNALVSIMIENCGNDHFREIKYWDCQHACVSPDCSVLHFELRGWWVRACYHLCLCFFCDCICCVCICFVFVCACVLCFLVVFVLLCLLVVHPWVSHSVPTVFNNCVCDCVCSLLSLNWRLRFVILFLSVFDSKISSSVSGKMFFLENTKLKCFLRNISFCTFPRYLKVLRGSKRLCGFQGVLKWRFPDLAGHGHTLHTLHHQLGALVEAMVPK